MVYLKTRAYTVHTVVCMLPNPGANPCGFKRLLVRIATRLQSALGLLIAIIDLAIADPLLYQTDQRLQDFTSANYPSL